MSFQHPEEMAGSVALGATQPVNRFDMPGRADVPSNYATGAQMCERNKKEREAGNQAARKNVCITQSKWLCSLV